MEKLLFEAQFLADDTENIKDRLSELTSGDKDAIPLQVIVWDIGQLMYRYSRLRQDLVDWAKINQGAMIC